ncbi:2-dehydropantoate 2-reductase [Neorhizobium sp. P12A]|uniref:ketopantoate reductase family protein n=1 Tax=Rhizobium/Agrobacterium group TaxID=227290 RepID=UPI001046F45B|nr:MULTISPECIES: 2-dehydropantoate 2-reductase [Rhizobium/Agrobacterium group]KAA0690248.1 2-dehydropantoate 2-reductase [Neorhizobium sp. P12A]TCR71071.1 ketopantoate reductase [Rhizobium sp. BK376]
MPFEISNDDSAAPKPRICIAGAGAIGLTLATRLALGAYPVSVVARGPSLAAIKNSGVRLIDAEGAHAAKVAAGKPMELAPADILFLCSKAHDLPELASEIARLIGPETLIVPVINGIPWWYFENEGGRHAGRTVRSVDPDGRLKQLLPSSQVIGAVTTITAERLEPGLARSLNPLNMVIGEIDHRITARVEQAAAVLNFSGIATRVSDRIRDPLWSKVIANLICNPLSVLSGATLRDICAHPSLSRITRKLLEEGLLIAASYGARMELDPDALLAMGASKGDFKTSMLQDFERGQPLELAAICGAVIELAELQGISMPLTQDIATLAGYRSKAAREHELAAA